MAAVHRNLQSVYKASLGHRGDVSLTERLNSVSLINGPGRQQGRLMKLESAGLQAKEDHQ